MNSVALFLPRLRRDQWEIVRHKAKTKCLAMGRRWGKSVLGQCVAIPTAAAGGKVAWVVPNYRNGNPLWRLIERSVAHLKKQGLVRINKSERTVEFLNTGGFLAIYSMDNPDSIRGECFHLVIVDEAAMVSAEAWTDCIQPTLADYDGDAILISTPKGRNWFFEEYQRGLQEMALAKAEGREPRQASFHAPTGANPSPNIRKAFELVKARVPENTYRQEWLAEFLEDGGTVFRNVKACSTATQREPYQGTFVAGLDWGKSNDWTVIPIMDVATGEVVDWARFNQIGWRHQRARVRALFDKWKPAFILAEENSIGGPNIEALQDEGIPVVPFYTGPTTKNPLIESLVLSFEREEIKAPSDETCIGEIESYESEKSKTTGRISYNAPVGLHDDWVIALALCDWARIHFIEYVRALLGTGTIPANFPVRV